MPSLTTKWLRRGWAGAFVQAALLGGVLAAPVGASAQQSAPAGSSGTSVQVAPVSPMRPVIVKPASSGYVAGEVAGMFLLSLLGAPPEALKALAAIEQKWEPGFEPMAFETMMMTRDPVARVKLLDILQQKTGQKFGPDLRAWLSWAWANDLPMHPDYPNFKKTYYSLMDKKFREYFGPNKAMSITLNEVVWGGVAQDGIPPLRDPAMLNAKQAGYLADTDVVYGISIKGDERAYPKRILAWHEMFVDTIGGERIAGVYCTLCGTVIAFHTKVDGVVHELGTSGFLYRSNKLMYDKATQSLWSTMRGEPVIGALVGQNIRLKRDAVVTTTWGEWRRRHPESKVLSLATGYQRDYGEGVAYRGYFATDELMFPVPAPDGRLANKAEVLGLILDDAQAQALAIDANYLKANPIHHDETGAHRFVVLTDVSGANRVYAAEGQTFNAYDGNNSVTAADGQQWTLTEAGLTSKDGRQLTRLPAHRAFWFGWHAAFPDTRLVK
jgi:hypothetical protein